MSNYVKNIAVVGVTGTVGKFITAELIATGKFNVTAISREGSTAPMPSGVSVARVDYSAPGSLVSAMRGHDVLIITMATTAPRDTSIKLVEAAAEAGVPYVMPNEWGPDLVGTKAGEDAIIGPGAAAVRHRIEELGVSSYIGLISGFWYEYSLGLNANTFGMDWKRRQFTFFDDGRTKINTSTWPQSGRAVARLLSLPITGVENGQESSLSDYKNKSVFISSFLVSQRDMFESVLRASKTKVEDWTIKHEDVEQRWKDARDALFNKGDRLAFQRVLYSRVFFRDGNGNFEGRVQLANTALGLPAEDLDEFTRVAIDRAESGMTYHQADYSDRK